jgi:hypothetical protein
VWIGDPIARRPGEEPRALLDEARTQIAATLGRWRGTPPDAVAARPPAA